MVSLNLLSLKCVYYESQIQGSDDYVNFFQSAVPKSAVNTMLYLSLETLDFKFSVTGPFNCALLYGGKTPVTNTGCVVFLLLIKTDWDCCDPSISQTRNISTLYFLH